VTKLKPCPFCGGEAYFDKDDNGWQWIECGKCHVATNQRASLMEDCKPLLAEAWNTRSTIDSGAIRAAALKDAADRAVSWQVKLCSRDDWHCDGCTECNQLRYAILSAEPAQDDGKAEVGDVVAWVNSGGDIRVGQFGIEITQGDAVVIRRRAEVKHQIEEAKE
jgi:hypothetical protein